MGSGPHFSSSGTLQPSAPGWGQLCSLTSWLYEAYGQALFQKVVLANGSPPLASMVFLHIGPILHIGPPE